MNRCSTMSITSTKMDTIDKDSHTSNVPGDGEDTEGCTSTFNYVITKGDKKIIKRCHILYNKRVTPNMRDYIPAAYAHTVLYWTTLVLPNGLQDTMLHCEGMGAFRLNKVRIANILANNKISLSIEQIYLNEEKAERRKVSILIPYRSR